MSHSRQDETNKSAPLTRYGHPIYEVNPSLSEALPVRIRTNKPNKLGGAYMVAPGTGEVVGRGAFAFVEEKEVDSEQFVKIYLAGLRQYGELSKAGATIFEFVYKEISGRDSKDKDTVTLNFLLAQRWKADLSRRTYERGMNELLEKGFLYRSLAADVYFVNVRFMFNGDRMVLVQSYRRKGSIAAAQTELLLLEQQK
ncbi:hypothetical protein KSC_054340 [Ktedonobacter sp. SOSP1-52]|uniref:hypothetical protein n=1 Tax=Ktedonobacter sp. SOSP1-52 TaxID=2778366 RepID=UPI001915D097|nr:hypothetical protein [Ktedonobacter sp. SOSP1-52]GHO66542.1 hypothetical protein KSC_054340 [Ktedonobacter sp. SOSP1-52]